MMAAVVGLGALYDGTVPLTESAVALDELVPWAAGGERKVADVERRDSGSPTIHVLHVDLVGIPKRLEPIPSNRGAPLSGLDNEDNQISGTPTC
jgi:hypothetical protein